MIEKSITGNMKDDEELEMLLNEIPNATSSNLHHHHNHLHHQNFNNHVHGGHSLRSFATRTSHGIYGAYDDQHSSHCKNTCASPVSGLSLRSDGSSSSLFSNGQSFSDNGSPTPPPLEEFKSLMPCGNSHYPDGLWFSSQMPDSLTRKRANESLIDEVGLCGNLNKMYISSEPEDSSSFRGFSLYSNEPQLNDQISVDSYSSFGNLRKEYSDHVRIQSPIGRNMTSFDGEMSKAFSGLRQDHEVNNVMRSQMFPGGSDVLFPQQELNYCSNPMFSTWQKTKEQTSSYHRRGSPVSNITPLSRLPMTDALFYSQQGGMNWNEKIGVLNFSNSQLTQPRPHLSVEHLMQCGLQPYNAWAKAFSPSDIRITRGGLKAFTKEDSLIIQGESLNYATNKIQNKSALHEIGMSRPQDRRSQRNGQPQVAGTSGNARGAKLYSSFSLPPKYNSLAEARGYICLIAKDQHGCRFLQRMFDEGTQQDVQIIFNEIIGHVVELMTNPFGNYLMQKLLEVCTEEQRMQMLLMATEQPGQLVQISLNTHGTRVVQKLIETLKTREQISVVISALEPGFLALIKDLNGNHVIQRCLQCLSNEDNKFIFVAAAKYCVDIATHQHGCCVLQRCISHSTGKHQENLVTEISSNGLLLAQDAFGNYVVQFILELKMPSAASRLISQFEGNYVHLSMQKFSSHVVEKCLVVFNSNSRSRIIHELLSAPHFEQLLQDPHANYVVQTALQVSEGSLHNLLVEAIEAHKAVSRSSPYSKKLFSQKILKK